MQHSRTDRMGLSYSSPPTSPLHHSHHDAHSFSQPAAMNPLPLPPRSWQAPDPKQARRRIVQDYLKSLNSMTRCIVLETETLEHSHLRDWRGMNDAKKEEVVNDHFIPTGVRRQYEHAYVNVLSLRSSRGPYSGASDGALLQDPPVPANFVLRNHTAAVPGEDFTLSQPTYYNYDPSLASGQSESTGFTQTYRLHKKQLSFRSNTVNAVNPQGLPQGRSSIPSLGSDGESPRTSDEDSTNLLGFNRNRFRSYSMRPKKGSGRTGIRSSNRSAHRVRRPMTPDVNTNRRANCRDLNEPVSRHYNEESSVPVYEGDDEIDMPLDSLLLDHGQDEPLHQSMPAVAPQRYSRTRKSQRSRPKIVVHDDCDDDADGESESDLVIHNRYISIDSGHPESVASLSANTSNSSLPGLHTDTPAEKSIEVDPDCISITPSLELLEGRMTPDSVISSSSNVSFRPRSRKEELAVQRNPRGKRGGSSYRTATSEFADRHSQFKSNMLRKLRSGSNTREGTPVCSTPIPGEDCFSQGFLKLPALSTSTSDSLVESDATDLPFSPALSSPATPLMQSLLKAHLQDSNRESGYISSGSNESFAFRR